MAKVIGKIKNVDQVLTTWNRQRDQQKAKTDAYWDRIHMEMCGLQKTEYEIKQMNKIHAESRFNVTLSTKMQNLKTG